MGNDTPVGALIRSVVLIMAGFGSGIVAPPACAVQYYTATPLGTLGGIRSEGFGINDSGEVIGVYVTSVGITRGFLYSRGVMRDLGTLGGDTSSGHGINTVGQVTGTSFTVGNGALHAFVYSGGAMTDLGTLGGPNSFGEGINASGQVTGYSIRRSH